MEALLIGIYSFFVWLIFIKLKWLPWNTVSQVTVVIIPIVGLTALILLLNVYAPSSSDVRVIKYVVQIVPHPPVQIAGRELAAGHDPRRIPGATRRDLRLECDTGHAGDRRHDLGDG